MIRLIFLFLFAAFFILPAYTSEKPRVIVLTDIGEDPDDEQSLVRFLLYSCDFDVEGIVATTTHWMRGNSGDQPVNPAPEYIYDILDAYAKLEWTLRDHSSHFPGAADYPTADFLRERVFEGNHDRGGDQNYGMDDVGEGLSSDGSNHIIEVLKKDDDRPVWILIWGGANTLAQAVYDIDHGDMDASGKSMLLSKIRAYDIAGQDDAGGWIAYNYPEVTYLRSVFQYRGMAYASCYEYSQNNYVYRSDNCSGSCCRIDDEQGGYADIFTPGWISSHIKELDSPLADGYPRKGSSWSEGQSPSFLFLINNGLSYPDSIAWGSWGGRFRREKECGEAAQCDEQYILPYDYKKSYCMYVPARDWAFTPRESQFTWNRLAPVFRWREEMSWDFEARMQWTIKSAEATNHNPVIKLKEHTDEELLFIKKEAGGYINLDATESYDPDGDGLSYHWWIYHEAGFYSGETDLKAPLENANSATITYRVPDDASTGDIIHLILELSDNGEPELRTYQRVVIEVCNDGSCVIGAIKNQKNINMNVYPNPAKDCLYVQTTSPGQLSIIDQLGCKKLIKDISALPNPTTIDICNLACGQYFLSFISDEGESDTFKFLKIK